MPLYQQIRQYLSELMSINPNLKKLPSERELQDKYNSTRVTIREALSKLEAEGIIYRQNRRGWFVCPPRLNWDPVKKVNFYRFAQEQNFTPRTQLISCDKITASASLQARFELAQTEPMYRISRVRFLNERPVMIEDIYCRVEPFQGLEDKPLEASVTTIFEQDYGINISHESSSIFVTSTPEDKAHTLNLGSGAPCLKIIRNRFNQDNQLIDHNIEYWVHSAIEINVTSN